MQCRLDHEHGRCAWFKLVQLLYSGQVLDSIERGSVHLMRRGQVSVASRASRLHFVLCGEVPEGQQPVVLRQLSGGLDYKQG